MALRQEQILLLQELKYDHKMSNEAIASVLGCHRHTVARHLRMMAEGATVGPRPQYQNGILDRGDQSSLTALFRETQGNGDLIASHITRAPERYGLVPGTTVSPRTVRRFFQTRHPKLAQERWAMRRAAYASMRAAAAEKAEAEAG